MILKHKNDEMKHNKALNFENEARKYEVILHGIKVDD
jgi:hypothetical protein